MKYQQFTNCGLLFLCFFFQTQAFAQCSYLAYESFSYTPNTAIFGQQAGSGWAEPWTIQNNDTNVPGYHTAASNLSYPNLQTIGNQLSTGSGSINAGRNLDRTSNGPFENYLNRSGFIGANGTNLWMSALVQKNAANDDWVFIELNGDPVPWVIQGETEPYSDPHLGVGYYGTASDVGGERRWSLRIWDSVYPMSVPMVDGQSILLVLNVTFDATNGHQIDVYIDPVLGIAPPSPTYSHTYNGDMWFSGIVVHGSSNYAGVFDEIRLADSYPCVAPDNTVSVNLPPTANFTNSMTDGISPMLTMLDASSSFDTDGTIVSYEWNFNDGSPVFTQNATTPLDHTFTATGVFNIELKVTDDNGANNTFVQEIIVRESDGSFTCQIGANLEQAASCSQAIGRIRIENTYNGLVQNHQLYDANMQSISVGGNDTYSNLAAGNYTLISNGAYGCIDTLSLQVPVDSSTCAGWIADLCRMESGMNLNFATFWTSERPFKNLFNFNSGFRTYDIDVPWINTALEDVIPVDAAGYPLEVPWTDGTGMSHIVKTVISDNGYYPLDTLVVLYDGTGNIQSTAPMINVSTGRFEIIVTSNDAILFDIYASQLGNHIRNIRVLRPEYEFEDLVAGPFHQNFLDRLSPFQSIRFMNWQGINGSPISDWSERNLPTYFNQGEDGNPSGVSYEYLIELCNTLDADPWICIPHLANDDYVIQLAHLFRDNLDPELNVYIEYSNEVWNWGFSQSHWVTDNGPTNISYPRRYAQRASRLINIFKNEFGSQQEQVKRVLGTQLTGNWVTNEILSQTNQDDYDYLSPSAYFGMDDNLCGNALDASSTPEDVIDCTRQTFYNHYASWKQDYQNAKMYGKEIITYEAGNHMTNFDPNVPYLQAMQTAQTHPEIYNLYEEVIDSLHQLDSRMNMFFVLAARMGNSVDTFGHLDDIDQAPPYITSAPKYQVLLDDIDLTCEPITLPVELLDFTVRYDEDSKSAVLNWITVSETNNKEFVIEKSLDGLVFEKIGQVSGQRTTTEEHHYEFVDEDVSVGKYYYRIKQVDFDDSEELSEIKSVTIKGNRDIKVFPNPITKKSILNITFESLDDSEISIRMIDILGRLINEKSISVSKGRNELRLETAVEGSGAFLLQILGEEGEFFLSQIVLVID
jgi:PKD repeat protein